MDKGFDVGGFNVLATFNTVIGVNFDTMHSVFYKIYDEDYNVVPMSLVMKKRDTDHYLNVNSRVNSVT